MDTTTTPEASAASSAAPKPKRSRPTNTLPTDRIGFQKQLDMLRVYATVSGATRKVVSLAEVENIIKMKASTISLASPFFTDIGLLQKSDKGFVPSDAVLNFQRAHQWNPETASHKLSTVIGAAWFSQHLLPTLQYREMSEEEAINALADACSASPEYEPQLRLLLDYMAGAGLIVKDGMQIRAVTPASPERTQKQEQREKQDESDSPPPPKVSSVTTAFTQPTEGTIQFHVSVRVDMAEFSGWPADRIAAFFGGIAQVLAAKGAMEKSTTRM